MRTLSMKHLIASLTVAMLLLGTGTAGQTATYYVAQNHPQASDSNPGTEALPWRTLTHSCAVAEKGDTVWVKTGLYHETLEPHNDGVTFQAFGDDTVVIAPASKIIDPTAWSKVADRQYVYQCKADAEGKMLRVDGLALQFEQITGIKVAVNPATGERLSTPVDRHFEDTDIRRWTRLENGVLQINLGGDDPAQHRVELVPADFTGIRLTTNACRVKGFEVRDAQTGIFIGSERNTVEDCLVRGAGEGVILKGWANTLRRCTLIQCWMGINAGDCDGAHLIEENFIIGTGHPLLRNRSPQTDLNNPWGPRCSVRFGNINFCVFRHNVVADGVWAGWWPDVNCYSNYFYGNLLWRITDRGIYNEYPANDSRIFYNAIVGCNDGITYRFCWHTMTMYNYLANNRNTGIAFWGPHLDAPYLFDNLIAKNLVTGSRVYLSLQDHQGLKAGLPMGWPGGAEMSASARYRMLSNIFANNLYRGQPGDSFADFNGVKFSSLARFQEFTHMEQGSRMDDNARMEDLALGLYTVRVPESLRPQQPVPLVGNPLRQGVHTDPLPVAAEDAPYFWSQGDANSLRRAGGAPRPLPAFGYSYEWPHFQKPVRRLIRAQPGADPNQPLPDGAEPQVWLECATQKHLVGRIPAEGSGFWSPSLPTVPGARIEVSAQVSGEDITPVAPDGGPVILVWFQSLTGQHIQKVVLFGKQPDGRVVGEAPMAGTFPWRKIRANVIAPQTAKRFAIFLGLKPAQGTVRYGDIYIKTLPGLSPPVPTVQPRRYESISLGAYFNRNLDKDTGAAPGAPPPEEFPRDYCDLPILDLSAVKPGQYMAGPVPFVVTGRAIALRCFRRPPATLPLEMNDITIGRQVRALYFLHAGPIQMGAQEYWRYLIHYADGQVVEVIPVKSAEHLHYRQNYFVPQAQLQAAVVIDSCASIGPALRWINPRPKVAVESVDFRSMDAGQAVLLAITAGHNEWACNDSTILYNTCIENQNGFVWRDCQRMLGQYNYIADNNTGVGTWGGFQHPSPTDNIFRNNLVLHSDCGRKLDIPAVVWLVAIGKAPEDFQDEAAGWWSPSLPTVPGAKIRFSFLVAAENLEAPTEDGVVAWIRFSSATNQHVTRQFVFGKNDEGQLVGQGPYKGSFSWRKVNATVVAPEKAERFALFFGVRPCKGMARFADIDVQTKPGEPPAEDEPEPTGKAGAMDLEQEVRNLIREQAND